MNKFQLRLSTRNRNGSWTHQYSKLYNSVAEVPDWGKATIKKLVDKGYLKGNGKGLDLSEDLLRVLVINDRAGMYGSDE